MIKKKMIVAIAVVLPLIIMTMFAPPAANAASLKFTIFHTDQTHDSVGTVTATDSPYGLLLAPDLKGLPPGLLGFHVHQNPNCASGEKDSKLVAGLAAGGHFDPAQTKVHLGPYGKGHLGDLPPLYVGKDGSATLPVLAPRLKVRDLAKRSLMIHAGGDNFSDSPNPLGGGGARLACGLVDA